MRTSHVFIMKPPLGGLRFSLLSLLLATLTIGCGSTLYFRWQPWVLRHSLTGGKYASIALEFSSDGSLCAAIDGELSVRIWDTNSGALLCWIRDHSETRPYIDPEGKEYKSVVWEPMYGIVQKQFTPDGSRLITIGGDGSVRIWDARNGRHLQRIADAHPSSQSDLSEPDGLMLAQRGGAIHETEFSGKVKQSFEGRKWGSFTWLQLSDDRERIAYGGIDRILVVWERKNGKELFRSAEGLVEFARFSPDGMQVVAALQTSGVKVWTLETCRETLCFDKHAQQVDIVEVSPKGDRVFSSDGKTAYMWHMKTGEVLWYADTTGKRMEWVQFSRDGSRLYCSTGLSVFICDAASGAVIHQFAEKLPCGFGVSRNEQQIAIPTRAGGIELWEKRRDESVAGVLVLPELWGTVVLVLAFVWSLRKRPQVP